MCPASDFRAADPVLALAWSSAAVFGLEQLDSCAPGIAAATWRAKTLIAARASRAAGPRVRALPAAARIRVGAVGYFDQAVPLRRRCGAAASQLGDVLRPAAPLRLRPRWGPPRSARQTARSLVEIEPCRVTTCSACQLGEVLDEGVPDRAPAQANSILRGAWRGSARSRVHDSDVRAVLLPRSAAASPRATHRCCRTGRQQQMPARALNVPLTCCFSLCATTIVPSSRTAGRAPVRPAPSLRRAEYRSCRARVSADA